MKKLKLGAIYYEISRHNPPALRIKPSETVSVETENGLAGHFQRDGDEPDEGAVPYYNGQSGPIYVEGAEEGDSLAIHIEKIDARLGEAVTMVTKPGKLGQYLGMDVTKETWIRPVKDGKVWWSSQLGIPYAPMIGTIGTAPAMGAPTSMPPGAHGGNLDLKEVTHGNTLYLPVYVPGALLHLGDAHAVQGDGELCGVAMEMASTVTMKIDLMKGKKIERPRIRSPQEIMAVATGAPMEDAVARAFADLILWMEEDYGLSRWHGYNLCTQVATTSMGYFGFGTVAAKIRTDYAEAAALTGQ